MKNFDDDIEESYDRRFWGTAAILTLIILIWCLISVPIIFFIPENYKMFFLFFWLFSTLIILKLCPWIVGKILKLKL